jgi:arsenic resistance protein ArsH
MDHIFILLLRFSRLAPIFKPSRPAIISSICRAMTKKSGDVNTGAKRIRTEIENDAVYYGRSFAIPLPNDELILREKYRPFLLDDDTTKTDWIAKLELNTALKMVDIELLKNGDERLRVLVLYGSLRERSYSRLLAFEASRILFRLGCDVRVFDPNELPVKDDVQHTHPKVQELRELSKWSDGHVWVSPEQHGNLVRAIILSRKQLQAHV